MTWNLNTIIVGVDGSEGAERAARHAVDVARTTGAKLYIATVVRPPEGWWGIGGAPPTPEALSTALIEGQKEVLDNLVAALDLEGVDYETLQDLGDPASRLIAIAEERNADLMVIGRRGAGLVERVIIGSVADRICHHSPCPVLLIP
ncbi:MAG: universal stress protein [Acidimicrobiales bacterium]|jgi:nucleotide-binding universal stress UspA family protein|nr:universal stress protein [Acidimicrobiales bacterium]HLV89809.1 universal stress protein [Acidimicrobiia bacterium]